MLVADAAGARAADEAAIAAGIPSRALMQRAGAAAAGEIARRFATDLSAGVLIATGAGNNGGDGWVVAAALHAVGIRVRVLECVSARTPDAKAERAVALAAGVPASGDVADLDRGGERILVDALLGTGYQASRPVDERIAAAIGSLAARAQSTRSRVVALDLPSGMDAGSGAQAIPLRCAATMSFGTLKRGQLVSRDACGDIIVLDIGLGPFAADLAGTARLATPAWFERSMPRIAADAHKGTRRKVAIIGGAEGMAGAVVLAARAALRSGAGLVKCVVSPESLRAVQEGEPAALATTWPDDDDAVRVAIADWADAVLIGPGLGRRSPRELVERVLGAYRGPVVLDADALNAFAGDAGALRTVLGARAALLTPHPAEFARLIDASVDAVLADRFDLPAGLAATTGAATLLKGVPTIVAASSGQTTVVAEGTPMLATGGAGDVLGGMAATLLAQTGDAALAGALAAYAHGRAASLVSARDVRGYTLDDILLALPVVWSLTAPTPRPPVLGELPAVGERP